MRLKNSVIIFSFIFLSLLIVACERKLTPCECGKNLSKFYNEIDQVLEVKCEEYVLNLSNEERKTWNKDVLDCTSDK